MYDICIIGGGASGMIGAIAAAKENRELRICILEKKETPGKKLLAAGNGKCNITNEECEASDKVIDFFNSLGIMTRTDEEGRVYPYSEQGAQVVDLMIQNLKQLGVEIRCDSEVTDIKNTDTGFEISCKDDKKITAKQLLIATGGKAGPQFGCTGDGYKWARAFGHAVTKLAPVLTALECRGDFAALKGIRTKGEVYLFDGGDMVAREPGEVQFTADGVSGICVFNASREIKVHPQETFEAAMNRYSLSIDLVPDKGEEELIDIFKSRKKIEGIGDDWRILETIISSALAKAIVGKVGTDPHKLAAALKYYELKIAGVKGWRNEQCTSGGVVLEELDDETMGSKIVKGLYFAGEITDYDGPCGGFNLQNAWITGIKAGRAMAHNV